MGGIPAFQLELPNYFRCEIVKNTELLQLFAKTIAEIYNDVIVPWWSAFQTEKLGFNNKYALELTPKSNLSRKQSEQMVANLQDELQRKVGRRPRRGRNLFAF